MNKFKELCKLYWAFLKIGGLTFGGGLTMLPMLEHELVDKNNWITEEELLDCYAIGQCTPGIIAINTATFVGYKREKVLGGFFSTLGMVTPSLVIITAIAACLNQFMDNVWFQHAIMGIRGVVCALLMNTALNLGKKSLKNLFAWIIYAVVLLVGLFLKLPTIVLVLSAAAVGIFFELIKSTQAKKTEAKTESTESVETVQEEKKDE